MKKIRITTTTCSRFTSSSSRQRPHSWSVIRWSPSWSHFSKNGLIQLSRLCKFARIGKSSWRETVRSCSASRSHHFQTAALIQRFVWFVSASWINSTYWGASSWRSAVGGERIFGKWNRTYENWNRICQWNITRGKWNEVRGNSNRICGKWNRQKMSTWIHTKVVHNVKEPFPHTTWEILHLILTTFLQPKWKI